MSDSPSKYKLLSIGVLTGFLSGILGIGGGLIIIPLMTNYLKYDQKIAQGTSLAVIFPISLFGCIGYFLHSAGELNTAVTIGAGSMLGILLGSMIVHRFNSAALSRIFSSLIMLVGMKMLLG